MKKVLTIIALIAAIGLYFGTYALLNTIQSSFEQPLQTAITKDQSEVKTFYQPERQIKTAIIAQIPAEPDRLRSDLQLAGLTLFKTLPQDQQIDNFLIIYDPLLPPNEPESICPTAQHHFPQANCTTLRPQEDETQIYQEIKTRLTETTLIILHTYYSPNQEHPQLIEIQKDHLKNAFDNFTKANLDSIPFTNREAIKAVYQINKEQGNLKTLPALHDHQNNFFLQFVAPGPHYQSEIVTLTFLGDIMLGRYVRTLMEQNTHDYPFQKLDQSFLRANDLLIGNLEGPIATTKINTSKAIAFYFPPDTAKLLRKYYFDGVSMANNHALDMGSQGLADTYTYLQEQGIKGFGHPQNSLDDYIWKIEKNGLKLAFIGLNDVDFKIKPEEVEEKISQLNQQSFLVIPIIHWGTEYVHSPQDKHVKMAHQFIDAGAFAIIGHHPHVVQSLEIYKQRPIFYSLGNAVFDQYFSEDTQVGISPIFRITPDYLDIYIIPFRIDQSQMILMTEEQRNGYLKEFAGYWRYDQETKIQIENGKIRLSFENPQELS